MAALSTAYKEGRRRKPIPSAANAGGGKKEPDEVVIWTPSPKQSEFLAASEYEVLYGGAAGGGKTDGLLIDALGIWQGAIFKRKYQAIIFRKTFPDLKDIIDRSHEIYPLYDPGAKFDKQAHVWTFSSGARIEFGFIQRDGDRFRYRGRAFQYIGWEELTLWPTSTPYLYLMSRIRTSDPEIVCVVRSTTNPDGPGFKWVKERWRIPAEGASTCFEYEVKDEETGRVFKRHRRFIPARVEDNPHLTDDYVITLNMLDDDDRRRLRGGKWETPIIKGAYYTKEIEAARAQGRITKVPYLPGIPVNTFWDLGANDTTAIVCHQSVAMQNRFLRSYEASGEGLSHFTRWMLEQGYSYGVHYLPHDAEHQKLGQHDTRSSKELLQELLPGHRFETVPRIDDVLNGIQMTRNKFPSAWFDVEGCEGLIAALENYRKVWDETQQVYRDRPLHDWASNYADAFRQYGQAQNIGGGAGGSARRKAGARSSARTA